MSFLPASIIGRAAKDRAKRLGGSKVLSKFNRRYAGAGLVGSGIGAYRGNKNSEKSWEGLSSQEKALYVKAYGSKARAVYKKKQTVQGGVSGFLDGYGIATMAPMLKRSINFGKVVGTMAKYDPHLLKDKDYMKKVMQVHLFETPVSATGPEKKKGNLVSSLGKNFLLPALQDSAIIYGAANAYGEATKYRIQRRESSSSSKKSNKQIR